MTTSALRRTMQWWFLLAVPAGIVSLVAGFRALPVFLPANVICHVAPYLAAGYFSLRIASDYPAGSRMRAAWRLMALSAGLALVRQGFEWVMLYSGLSATYATTWTGIRQVPINASLAALMAACALMWLSFAAMGFGLSPKRRDYALIASIVAIVPLILYYHDRLSDSRSVFLPIRYLQYLSPVLIAASAALGVVLYRISRELGQSGLATSLRYLVLFLVARLVALFLQLPEPFHGNPPVAAVRLAIWSVVPSLFALAALDRWRLQLGVSEMVAGYRPTDERTAEQLLKAAAQVAAPIIRSPDHD